MKLSFGKLIFEKGDILNIEDEFGKETFVIKSGQNCNDCEFYTICNKKNPNNLIARFCKETHFENCKKKDI